MSVMWQPYLDNWFRSHPHHRCSNDGWAVQGLEPVFCNNPQGKLALPLPTLSWNHRH